MGWPINRDIAYNFDALFSLPNDAGHIICLSDRDVDILISSLRFAHWPTRWVDSDERVLRDHGRVSDLYLANDYIAELEDRLMGSCGVEIRAGLEAVAAGIMALANKPCCNDQTIINIYQGTSPGGNQIYGTQPPSTGNTTGLDPETDPPPEGYDTWEEYYADKCQKANYVADGLIGTVVNISVLSVVNEIGLGALLVAAAVGAVTLPLTAIPVIVGLLLAQTTILAALGLVGTYLVDHRSELVCGLFLSDNSGDAVDFFAALIDEALAAVIVATELHPAIRTIALIVASTDAINKLWDATVKVEYAGADCSGCQGDPIVTISKLLPDQSWVEVVPSSVVGLVYTLPGIASASISGVADSVVLSIERTSGEGPLFGVKSINYTPDYEGTTTTVPRNVQGYNSAGVRVLDGWDWTPEADVNEQIDIYANMSRVQLWSVVGDLSAVVLELMI